MDGTKSADLAGRVADILDEALWEAAAASFGLLEIDSKRGLIITMLS